MDKSHWIKLFRDNGFNCFPIPKYPDSYIEHKAADIRYKGVKTELNQIITDSENYGVIPIKGEGTCIVDLDHKENYRAFAEQIIKQGYTVFETPNGWHIPIKGLAGEIRKVMLFDYAIEQSKQIVEIQGHDHYILGVGCSIIDKKTKERVEYKSVGSEKIYNAKGKDFHDFIDFIAQATKTTPPKKSRSSHKAMRTRFLENQLPTKGTSNLYFYNASIQCLTDEVTLQEAIERIKVIYDKWEESPSFSGRHWDNVLKTIENAYEFGEPLHEGRPQGGGGDVNEVQIAQTLLEGRQIYSDIINKIVYENKNGFLQDISKELQRELQKLYPVLKEHEYNDVMFKLRGLADEIPPLNKDIVAFKNGKYNVNSKEIVDTDDIADMGFKDYDLLPNTSDNEPKEFLKTLFKHSPEKEHPRIKAGLRAIMRSRLDPKISIIHGDSGVGKSTPLTILGSVLGPEYAYSTSYNTFIEDRATQAKIKGKRFFVFHDMPKSFKDYALIKSITGEKNQSIRDFQEKGEPFDNKIKIWASGNYLAAIPEQEKDAMYSRRLSLIHNQNLTRYDEDDEFIENIVKDEGEKIISWIFNLKKEDCMYEDRVTVRAEWEELSSPELAYLLEYYELNDNNSEIPVSRLVKDYQSKYQRHIPIDTMVKSLKSVGYSIKNNLILNIQDKIIPDKDVGQKRI